MAKKKIKNDPKQNIKWADRVPQELIRNLYNTDAKHIQDTELLNEVGYALYARSESFIKVNCAHSKNIVTCPKCNADIYINDDMFECQCKWSISKRDYNATYKKQHLVGPSVVPFAEKFIFDWEKAKDSYAEKMKAIDYLIHSFHWELNQHTGRPAAINFIEGKLMTIIEFIFDLAYGYDEGVYHEQMQRWLENAEKSSGIWKAIKNNEYFKPE